MPKRKFKWWGTVDAILNGHAAFDRALKRVRSEFPGTDVDQYVKLVYFQKTNTQEGAAAMIGIDRREANAINFKLHCYIAEEMGYFGAKNS